MENTEITRNFIQTEIWLTSIGLAVDGSSTFDKLKVADTFNEVFFTTVADKLLSKRSCKIIFLSLCSVKP